MWAHVAAALMSGQLRLCVMDGRTRGGQRGSANTPSYRGGRGGHTRMSVTGFSATGLTLVRSKSAATHDKKLSARTIVPTASSRLLVVAFYQLWQLHSDVQTTAYHQVLTQIFDLLCMQCVKRSSILRLPARKQCDTLPRVSVSSGFAQNEQPV